MWSRVQASWNNRTPSDKNISIPSMLNSRGEENVKAKRKAAPASGPLCGCRRAKYEKGKVQAREDDKNMHLLEGQ